MGKKKTLEEGKTSKLAGAGLDKNGVVTVPLDESTIARASRAMKLFG